MFIRKIKSMNKLLRIISYNFLSFLYFKPEGVANAISFFFDYSINFLKYFYTLLILAILGREKFKKYYFHKKLYRPFVPFSFVSKITINGKRLKIKIRKNHDDFFLLNPLYEKDIIRFFKPSGNDIAVDVGAHVGKYTLYFSKCLDNGKVIAIEPNKESFKTLLENLKLNNCNNVIAYNVAISDKKGRRKLFITEDDGRSSFSKRSNNYQIVEVVTLSSILRENKIKVVDWMKIDVEGAEILVLKGMKKYLKKIKNLIIEVQNENEQEAIKILSRDFKTIKEVFREREQKYYLAQN